MPKRGIELRGPVVCTNCWYSESPRPYEIRVVELRSEEAGHVVGGEYYDARCPNCGVAFRALLRHIPIEVESVPCQKCGETGTLEYEVLRLTKAGRHAYDFEVLVKCVGCGKKRRLKKVITRILEVGLVLISFVSIMLKRG